MFWALDYLGTNQGAGLLIKQEVKLYTFFISFLAPCTFTKTGKSYADGHYYECVTCDMTNSGDGYSICTTCIKICHAEHDVRYVGYGPHFCDCGEKGEKSCKALKSKSNI